MAHIAYFETEEWEVPIVTRALQGHEVWCTREKFSPAALPQGFTPDAISIFVGTEMTGAAFAALPQLRLLTTRSTGFDHIDCAAAKARGIAVAYVPGYGDHTVAEYAFGLMLTLSRKIYEAYDRIRETGSFSLEGLRGFDLAGKTLGVVGTGRIGCHAIRIGNGFDMKVVAYDTLPKQELCAQLGFVYVPLDELLAQSDIVTLHVPYSKSTHHLINAETLAMMKRSAILVNTSRGGVVDTDALAKALAEGKLGGAGLDVLEEEGAIQDERSLVLYGHPEAHNLKTVLINHVLIDMPNVVITPHNAFNTQEALERILGTDIENITSFIETGAPKYPVPVR